MVSVTRKMNKESMDFVIREIEKMFAHFMQKYSFQITEFDKSDMGEWYVIIHNNELLITISNERNGQKTIEIGSKKRPKPHAPFRNWSLSHLRGFLDNKKEHFIFKDLQDQVNWLETNSTNILDPSFLNSDQLKKWAKTASRKQFENKKQKPRNPLHTDHAPRGG